MKQGHNPNHYLCVLGFCGGIICAVQSLVMEMKYLKEISNFSQSNAYLVSYYFGFAVCLCGMYSISPYYFKKFGATMYNLSLITSTVYSLILGILFFGEDITWLYIVGYCLVLCGILLYNKPRPQTKTQEESLVTLSE